MSSILLKNVRAVCPAQNMDAVMNVRIENGIIAELNADDLPADKIIDCKGLTACPGFVDMHVHLRDPGQTYKEDILSGCAAAAAGGVTSVLAMPNTRPTVDNAETVEYILEKAKNAKSKVYVAASITKGLESKEPTDIDLLKKAGAVALSDDGRPVENTAFMAAAMIKAKKLGMRVVAHCEDLFLADGGKINEGEISKQLNIKGIPAAAEDCGTAREIALAAAYNVPIHICHVSTATSVELIRDAKKRGVQVTCETAPHYISLTEDVLLKKDADYRMNPPLRTQADKIALTNALRDGTVDAIATDHAPHSPQEKSDFVAAPNGSLGLETSFAVCNTYLVAHGALSLNQLITKMSLNPARILGINAGTLKVGAPADIAIVDTDYKWTVDENKLHSKSKNTPFKGMELTGKVMYTLLNGQVVYEYIK